MKITYRLQTAKFNKFLIRVIEYSCIIENWKRHVSALHFSFIQFAQVETVKSSPTSYIGVKLYAKLPNNRMVYFTIYKKCGKFSLFYQQSFSFFLHIYVVCNAKYTVGIRKEVRLCFMRIRKIGWIKWSYCSLSIYGRKTGLQLHFYVLRFVFCRKSDVIN